MERILRICLHSFILAVVNIGVILIGFQVNKLLGNQIAVQSPISALLCILVFLIWNSLIIQHLPFKRLLLQGRRELIWVYIVAMLWSPIIFCPLHLIRWGYQASIRDILSIWLFQLSVNFLVILSANKLTHFGHETAENELNVSVKRPNILLTNIFLATTSGVFTLLIAELMLQIFYTSPAIVSGWRSLAPGSEKNQLGFRGQPIEYDDDDFIIVLLGDSQVEANMCAYGWMPERRLQHYLNTFGKKVKVFTLGASGYGQDQQLLVLQEYYRKYRTDLVILWQTPGNDIWNNMFPTNFPTNGVPKPTFWLENDELYGPSEQMGEKLDTSPIKLVALWRKAFASVDRDGEWEKYLPQPYSPIVEYKGSVNKAWQERWNANLGRMRDENLDNEKSHLAILLTPRSKRMEYGLKLTRRLLQKIDKLVTSHNGKFVIFRTNKPSTNTSDEHEVCILNGKYYRISTEQLESNVNYINQGFQSFVIPVTITDWRVGPENGHLNEHATDQVMRDLANVLTPFAYFFLKESPLSRFLGMFWQG